MSEVKDLVTTPVGAVGFTGGRLVGYGIGRDEMLLQVDVTLGGGTIEYSIEARLEKNYTWQKIAPATGTYTDSVIVPLATVPEVRINISAQSGAAAIARAGVLVR